MSRTGVSTTGLWKKCFKLSMKKKKSRNLAFCDLFLIYFFIVHFFFLSSKGRIDYSVSISVVEIYNEQARDLLNEDTDKQKVDIREGKEGVYIPGLTELPCTGVDQAMDLLLNTAYKNRSVRGTSMNEHSSRSHCIVFANCIGVHSKTGAKTHGKLILIGHSLTRFGRHQLEKTTRFYFSFFRPCGFRESKKIRSNGTGNERSPGHQQVVVRTGQCN